MFGLVLGELLVTLGLFGLAVAAFLLVRRLFVLPITKRLEAIEASLVEVVRAIESSNSNE